MGLSLFQYFVVAIAQLVTVYLKNKINLKKSSPCSKFIEVRYYKHNFNHESIRFFIVGRN